MAFAIAVDQMSVKLGYSTLQIRSQAVENVAQWSSTDRSKFPHPISSHENWSQQ